MLSRLLIADAVAGQLRLGSWASAFVDQRVLVERIGRVVDGLVRRRLEQIAVVGNRRLRALMRLYSAISRLPSCRRVHRVRPSQRVGLLLELYYGR